MFIIEEGDCIFVHDRTGRLVYKSISVVQFKKFSEESMVIVTKESIDFINEVKNDGRYDVTVVSDTNFIAAIIHQDLILVQRKVLIPIIDIYNADFINVLRLYQGLKGSWVYLYMKLGIPLRILKPTHLKGHLLFGIIKGKPYICNLEKRELKLAKPSKNKGVSLQECLELLNPEVVR